MKNGDVVGVALDLITKRVYFHVNGRWRNGDPNTATGGTRVRRGMRFFPAVSISASSNDSGADSWTANFGASSFVYASPLGFSPFDS